MVINLLKTIPQSFPIVKRSDVILPKLSLLKQPKFLPIVDDIIACGRHKKSIAQVNCDLFKKTTGITLLSPTKQNLNPFKYAINAILQPKSRIPQGIDAVLIGHGEGSFKAGTWKFCETKQNVMEYLSSVLKKGQRVLAMTCETPTTTTSFQPGIGNVVRTTLDEPQNPAKIVEVGKGIVGHFVNGKATYYC